jgi:galactokinase
LIGEHIDYSGYGVLPMAIERDMVMAISVSKDGSCLSNLDSKFQSCEFKANVNIDIDSSVHIWSNYFLCGFKGICQSLGLKDVKDMYIMAHGTVPAGGGLSSSSAFVCCSAVGTHFINNGNLNKTEMTEAAILGEHFAGVQTGGMDQSISIMAPFGSALFIEFFPKLTASVVQFPKLQVNPIFVVANTLVVADKHTTAPTNYNLRVVETRLAAAVLHKFLTGETTTKIITLRNIQDLVGNSSDSNERKLELLSDIVDKHLEKLPYTLQDISSLLHLTEEQIKSLFIGSIVIKADKGFKLHARSKHTYLEALRVLQFKNICLNGSPNTIAELGTLMNASHESCRDLFECSCSELDELTGIAL